jgi:cell division protein FtsB
MASFGKEKTLTEYMYTKPVVFALGILVVFLGASVYERYIVERQMYLRRQETQQERQQLIERKLQLEERVEYLSGERGIEEEIRTHFDVAKDDEQVIILVGEEESLPTADVPLPQPKKWYQFWR